MPSTSTANRFRTWFRENLPLLSILAFALILRLTNIIGPVRGDDFTYLQAAHDLFDGAIDRHACCGLARVGIYWPIGAIYKLFGISFFTSILFPLLASLTTVGLIYGIGTLIKGKPLGLVAALLWASLPLDIVQSTQVLPDAIAATLTSAAVFCMLLALRNTGLKRLLFFALMAFLFVWIFYVKELSVLACLFCILYIVYYFVEDTLRALGRWWQSSRFRWVLVLLGLALFAGFAYVVFEYVVDFPYGRALAALSSNAVDTAEVFFLGLSTLDAEYNFLRSGVFDLYVPLFFAALLLLPRSKDRRPVIFLLAWFGFYLLFAEWGTNYGFSSLPIPYVRPDPTLLFDRRNFLFVYVPLILLMANFFADRLDRERLQKSIPWLVLASTVVWLLVRGSVYQGNPTPLLVGFEVLVLLFMIALPFWYPKPTSPAASYAGMAFLLVFTLASFAPVPRYNAAEWQVERSQIANFRTASEYLLQTDPEIPILAVPGNERRLNFASDYRLGFNWDGSEAYDPAARILDVDDPEELDESVYILAEQPSGSSLLGSSPAWQLVTTFGEEQDRRLLALYLQLSPEEALADWQQAQMAYDAEPTEENLQAYFQASIHALQLQSALDLVPLLRQQAPEFDPFPQIQQLTDWLYASDRTQSEVLVGGLFGLISRIQISGGLDLTYTPSTQSMLADGRILLSMESTETERIQLNQPIKPNHLYLLKAVIRSSLPVQVLDLGDLGGIDNLNSESDYPDWTSVEAVLITPADLPADVTSITIFELIGTENAHEGRLSIASFQFIEFEPASMGAP